MSNTKTAFNNSTMTQNRFNTSPDIDNTVWNNYLLPKVEEMIEEPEDGLLTWSIIFDKFKRVYPYPETLDEETVEDMFINSDSMKIKESAIGLEKESLKKDNFFAFYMPLYIINQATNKSSSEKKDLKRKVIPVMNKLIKMEKLLMNGHGINIFENITEANETAKNNRTVESAAKPYEDYHLNASSLYSKVIS